MHLRLLLLALLTLLTAPLGGADTLTVELKTPIDGQSVLHGTCLRMDREAVTLQIGEDMVAVPRAQIAMLRFPANPRATRAPRAKTAARHMAPQAPLAIDPNQEVTDPRILNTEAARALFAQIQASFMAPYAGRDNYQAALDAQQSLYDQLASGQMSLSQLQDKAAATAAEARSYNAAETAAFPELQQLLQQLDTFQP